MIYFLVPVHLGSLKKPKQFWSQNCLRDIVIPGARVSKKDTVSRRKKKSKDLNLYILKSFSVVKGLRKISLQSLTRKFAK